MCVPFVKGITPDETWCGGDVPGVGHGVKRTSSLSQWIPPSASSETAEQFWKLMERHEIGWLTWKEDDARAMLDAITRLEKELDEWKARAKAAEASFDADRLEMAVDVGDVRAALSTAKEHIEVLLDGADPEAWDAASAWLSSQEGEKTGAPPEQKPCERCKGSGRIEKTNHFLGFIGYKDCPSCQGSGKAE